MLLFSGRGEFETGQLFRIHFVVNELVLATVLRDEHVKGIE